MGTRAEGSAAWAAALGRVPSGLFVLTARHADGRETGMLASWVQQCSFDPPQVSFAVRKGRELAAWLIEGAAVVVNVVPEGGKALVAHFGKGFEPGEPAFDGLAVDRKAASAPVLTAALAYLDCDVTGWADAADHVLFLARVIGGAVLHDGRPTVHLRKSGMHY
jgi:flavin reductase (DIM6/NTAB) family NADH-FMN oxidoreductase RutF